MKRLIKYNVKYNSDEFTFSDTEEAVKAYDFGKNWDDEYYYCDYELYQAYDDYEVLPHLVDDDAGSKELRAFADKLGLKTIGDCREGRPVDDDITPEFSHVVEVESESEKKTILGFIKLLEIEDITPTVSVDNILDIDTLHKMIRHHIRDVDMGIQEISTIKGKSYLVLSHWAGYHWPRLFGYQHLDDALESLSIERACSTDLSDCHICRATNWNYDGQNWNFKIIDSCYYGIKCGCAHEEMEESLKKYVNNDSKAISMDKARDFESHDVIYLVDNHVDCERDIVLKEALEDKPNGKFIFAYEENCGYHLYALKADS